MTTTKIINQFDLTSNQADEIKGFAIDAVKDFFSMEVDFETDADGVTINNTDEEIIEMSNGQYDTVGELTAAADKIFFAEFEMRAKMYNNI